MSFMEVGTKYFIQAKIQTIPSDKFQLLTTKLCMSSKSEIANL